MVPLFSGTCRTFQRAVGCAARDRQQRSRIEIFLFVERFLTWARFMLDSGMMLATTNEQKDSIRAQLRLAARFLGQKRARERDPFRHDLFRAGLSAIGDAILQLETKGDALMVLMALNQVMFMRLDIESGRCVERARLMCRGSLIRTLQVPDTSPSKQSGRLSLVHSTKRMQPD